MTVTYVLLSPTFGMHQYTADLANRRVGRLGAGRVHLVTTTTLPQDRYAPGVGIHTPVTTRSTGFSAEGLNPAAYRAALARLLALTADVRRREAPDVVHFTGVHLWNVPLVYALRSLRPGLRIVHTLHDLAPHSGVRYGGLIRLWNRLIVASGATILVHGRCYRDTLLASGLPPQRVVYTPLLHGFWGWRVDEELVAAAENTGLAAPGEKPVSHAPLVIFFGRLEWYKGIDMLLEAWRLLQQRAPGLALGDMRLVLAGRVAPELTLGPLPPRTELRNRRIEDNEALDLFRQAALLVLPYRDATQTALVAAAARLGVPSLVTRTGALPEYVTEGVTGWTVPPADSGALAAALNAALRDRAGLAHMGQAAQAWYSAARREELEALETLYCAATETAHPIV